MNDPFFGSNADLARDAEHRALEQWRAAQDAPAMHLEHLRRRLTGANPLTIGYDAAGTPLALGDAYWKKSHGIVVGGTGSGKTVSRALSVFEIIKADLASSASTFGIAYTALDSMKRDLVDTICWLLARLWSTLPDRQKAKLIGMVLRIRFTESHVPAWPLFARMRGATAAYQADLITRLLLQESDTASEAMTFVLYNVTYLGILRGVPFSSRWIVRVLKDPIFRKRELTEVDDPQLSHHFEIIQQDLAKETLKGAIRRFLTCIKDDTVAAALRIPPSAMLSLGVPTHAKLVFADLAPSHVVSLGAARSLARFFASQTLLDARRRDTSISGFIDFDEVGALVENLPLLQSLIAAAYQLNRGFQCFMTVLTQSLSGIPGRLLAELLANSGIILAFRSDAGELLAPHRLPDPRAGRSLAATAQSFRAEVAALPPRAFYLWAKGNPPVRLTTPTVHLPNAEERESLLTTFDREIAPYSTIPIRHAKHLLHEWEREHVDAIETSEAVRLDVRNLFGLGAKEPQ